MGGTRRGFILLVMGTLGVVCITAPAAQRSSPYGTGLVKLVSTEWLQEHLKDPNLLIVDTQGDVYDYFVEHIPGAVYFNDQALRLPVRYHAG